jgi:hypothetical protein
MTFEPPTTGYRKLHASPRQPRKRDIFAILARPFRHTPGVKLAIDG